MRNIQEAPVNNTRRVTENFNAKMVASRRLERFAAGELLMLVECPESPGHSRFMRISRSMRSPGASLTKVSTAEPKPNQPGKVMRAWPQEKLQGMARRSSIRRDARREAGYQLDRVQNGLEPEDFKPMSDIGSGVQEIRIKDEAGIFRVLYVAKFEDAVYVLHCFQKKT